MRPEDNGLESGSGAFQYNSSLEGGYQTPVVSKTPVGSQKLGISLFKFNKLAIIITVSTLLFVGLIGGGAIIYDKAHSKNSSLNSLEANGAYKNGSTLSVNQTQQADLLTLGQVNQVAVNGQLTVNRTLVLTPSTTPTSPIAGEIYFDSTTNRPYFYNGSQFVSLQTPAQYVANIGGVAGNIVLGNGLTINGSTLNVSSGLLKSISSAASSTPVVNSLQGATGNVTLSSGSGISINGTTVSNTGVLNLTSSNGSIVITNNGSGSYDLALSGGGGVILGPSAVQNDSSNNPSIYINKTGSGNLLELQNNGVDQFVVNQSGNLSINGSFTQNLSTGTFSTGSGAISLNGNTTITGGNSLTVSSGATILGGTLGVTGASTLGSLGVSSFSDSGTANITGNTTLNGTLSVQKAVTLGSNSPATQGSLIFDNGTNNNAISMLPSIPTGSGGVTVEFPTLTGGSVDTFCVTGPDSNCGVAANTVTTSSNGTNGTIAEFTSTHQIANSPITDNGSNTLTIQSGYTLNVGTLSSSSNLDITPSGNVNINAGAQEVAIQGSASSYFSVSANSKTNTLAFASPTSGQPTNYTITVPDESGTICLDNDATNCGFATSGSGVTNVNGYTGVICIQDANINGSCSGSNVTINNATSSALGIASFNSTDFNVLSGAVSAVQNISTSGDVQFDSLSLGGGYNCSTPETGNLCLSTGGTVYTSNLVNPSSTAPLQVTSANSLIQFDQEGTTFEFPTGYGVTTHDICVSGVSCATGTGAAVILQPSSAQADDGSIAGIFINDVNSNCTLGTNCKDLIDLQNGSSDVFTIDQYGNAQFDQTLYANTIQPISGAGGIAIGTSGTSQSFTLQGNSGSEIEISNPNGGVSYVGIQNPSGGTASSQNVYYALDDTQAPSSGTNGGNTSSNPVFICTSANSYCTASSGITGTGTTGDVAMFSGTHSLANSIFSQSSSNISIVGSSSISSLTIGNISSTAGQLVFNNGTNGNSITFTQPSSQPSSAINVGLPSVAGTIAVKGTGPISVDNTGTISCSNCAVTGNGGTGANVVTTLNGLDNAVSITDSLNNAFSTSGQNVQIANATTNNLGLVKINNDGNITVSSGVIDTAQNIQTSSNPQFASIYLGSTGPSGNDGQLAFYDGSTSYKLTLNQLTLTNNQTIHIPNNSGTLIVGVGSSNNLTLNNGVVDTANAVDFPSSVTTSELLSGSGSLQIGSTSSVQPFTLNGTAGTSGSYSSLDLYGGTYNTKIDFASPATANNVYTFPDAGGISATVCLQNTGSSYNSCTYSSGVNGTGNQNQVAYFTGSGTVSSGSNFYDNSSTVGIGGISSGFGSHTQLTVNTNATAVNNAVTQLNSGTSNPTYIPLVVEGASSQTGDLLDIDNNLGNVLTGFNSSGNLYFGGSSANTITGASNESLTLQSQGTGQLLLNSAGSSLALQVGGVTEATVSSLGNLNLLNGSYQLGGSTTLSSSALTFTASTDSITGPSGSSITLDTTGSSTLNLGNANATSISLGNSNSTTTLAGKLSQTYSSSSANTADTINLTNSNSSGAGVAIQGIGLTPTNSTPTSGTNTLNILNFAIGSGTAASAVTNGINFASATGYTNFINSPNFVVGSNGVITLGTIGTTGGQITLNSSHTGGSFNLEPSSSQANVTTLTIPTDSSGTDTICLVTASNCSGSNAGSGDSNYIYNQTTQQSPGNINISSASSAVAVKIQGASDQNILNLYPSSSSSTPVAYFDGSGNLSAGTINGATITSTAFNTATISGGTLSGGSQSGSNLTSTTLTFSGASGTVTTNSGDNLTVDTGGSTSTLNLGNANATTIQLGNSSSATTLQSGSGNLALTTGTSTGNITLTTNNASSSIIAKSSTNSTTAFQVQNTGGTDLIQVDTSGNNIYLGGTTNSTVDVGAVGSAAYTTAINIGTSTGAAQTVTVGSTNSSSTLVLQAGGGITANTTIGQTVTDSATSSNPLLSQTVSSGTATGIISLLNQTVTNSNNTSTSTTVDADNINLIGTSNTLGTNILNGINFANVTSKTNNTFNGLYFGSGYTNGIDFSTNSGITDFINSPSAVLSNAGAFTGLTGVTSSGTVHGGTLYATTGFSANGTAGVADSCTSSQAILNATFSEGILTGGSCTAVQTAGINNGTSTQSANFNIQSAATGSVAAVIQGASGQTADLLDVLNGSGVTVLSVSASGLTTLNSLNVTGATTLASLSVTGTATANTLTYGTSITSSCSGLTGYIWVPGSSKYGTLPGFCVMKYDASNPNDATGQGGNLTGIPASVPDAMPWTNISQQNAETRATAACNGCHLITENEWMTIAENVLWQSSNWVTSTTNMAASGAVGTGILATGHNDATPNQALAPSANDSQACYGTITGTNTNTTNGTNSDVCGNGTGSQKRTLALSTGSVLWDFAGNVWQWSDDWIIGNEEPQTGTTGFDWDDFSSITQWKGLQYANPTDRGWNYNQGLGEIYTDGTATNNTLYGFVRGGNWDNGSNAGAFTLNLNVNPTSTSTAVGFRVAR